MGLPALVHGTHHARIKTAHDMLNGRQCVFAGGQADEGLLERAGLTAGIARGEVPSSRGDDLVALDPPALDAQPVAEAAAGSFDQADAAGFIGHLARGAEGFAGLQRKIGRAHV